MSERETWLIVCLGLLASITLLLCILQFTSCEKHLSDNNAKMGRFTETVQQPKPSK